MSKYFNLALVDVDGDILAVYSPGVGDLTENDEVNFVIKDEPFTGRVIENFYTAYKGDLWTAVRITTGFEPAKAISKTYVSEFQWKSDGEIDSDKQEECNDDTV